MGSLCAKQTHPLPGRPMLLSLETTANSFSIHKVLGRGQHSIVYLVTKNDTDQLFAMKKVSKRKLRSQTQREHALAERTILAKAKSKFLVHLHYSFQTSNDLYLILDYIPGGELLEYADNTGRFPIEVTRFYAAEILLGLEDIHSQEIIYRDLKLQNVLVDITGHIRLTDFNLAKQVDSTKNTTRTLCGTPEYFAPEVLKGSEQTFKIDYWCLGVLIYRMLEGKTPFIQDTQQELFKSILTGRFEMTNRIPEDAQELLKSLLQPEPWRRPDSVQEIKKFRFFQGLSWKKYRDQKVQPPLVPKTSQIPELTRVALSPQMSPQLNQRTRNEFQGFSYIASPYQRPRV